MGILSYSKRLLKNEDGIALVTALILGLLGMLMIATLILMVQTGTWFVGSKKRYQMTLEASHGGLEFFAKEIINRGISGQNLSGMGNYGGLLTPISSDADLATKLTTTGAVNYVAGVPVADADAYPDIDPDITTTFALPSGPNITLNTVIRSTSRGNSGTSTNTLVGGGVVNNTSGQITPMHIPYIYQVVTQGQGPSAERADLSSLYTY